MDNTERCSTDTKYKAVENVNNGSIMLIPVRRMDGQDCLLLSDVEAMAPTTTALLSNGKMIPFEVDLNTLLELVPKRVLVQDMESIWQIHTPVPSSEATVTPTFQQHFTEILQRTMHLEQQFDQLLHRLDHVNFSTEDDTYLGSLVSPATDHRRHHYQQHNTEHTTEEGNTEAEPTIADVLEGPSCYDASGDNSLAPHTTTRSTSPPPAFSDSSSLSSSASSSTSSNPPLSSTPSGRRSSNLSNTHHSTSIALPIAPQSPPTLRYYQRDQETAPTQSTTSLHSSSSSSSAPSPQPPSISTSLPLTRTTVAVTGATPSHRRLGDETMTGTNSTSSLLSPATTLSSSSVINRIDHTPEQQQQQQHHHSDISVAPPPSYETSIFGTIKALIQHIRLFEHHIPNRHKSPRWLARRAEWVGYEPQTIEQVAYQLVQLEMALLWTAVTESWIQERETWLTLVASARTERHLAGALVNLERHTLVTDEAWQSVRDDWTSELLEVIVSVGF